MAGRPRDPLLYSRFVRVVKFALPILAIAILSTVFLVQREDPFDGQLVFSDNDRQALDDGLTISNPQITGTSTTGGYRISAKSAVPDSANAREIRFTGLVATADRGGGRVVEITGDQGTAYVKSEVIVVRGNVVVTASDGFRAETERATADLAAGYFQTGPVMAISPEGQIEAGGLRIERGADSTKDFFFFEKGVKLVHHPEARTPQ